MCANYPYEFISSLRRPARGVRVLAPGAALYLHFNYIRNIFATFPNHGSRYYLLRSPEVRMLFE